MWCPDPRLTPLSEEAERGSSLFRRPSQRRATASSPNSAGRRRRESLPRTLMRQLSPYAGAANRSREGSPVSRTLPTHLANRRRPSIPLSDAGGLYSSSGSEALTSNMASSYGAHSLKSDLSAQLDVNLVNAINDALRQPIAVRDMRYPHRHAVFQLCKGLGGYMQLKKRLVPRIPKQRAEQLRVTVVRLDGLPSESEGSDLYCLLSIGPSSTATVPSEQEIEVPDSWVCLLGRTRLVTCRTTDGADWNDTFIFKVPYSQTELRSMTVHCYIWQTNGGGHSERLDHPSLSWSHRAMDEPMSESDTLVGNVCLPLNNVLSYCTPSTQTLRVRHSSLNTSAAAHLSLQVELCTPPMHGGELLCLLQTFITTAWENSLLLLSTWRQDHNSHGNLNTDGLSAFNCQADVGLVLAACGVLWSIDPLQIAAMHLLAASELCDYPSDQIPRWLTARLADNVASLLETSSLVEEKDLQSLEKVCSASDFQLALSMLFDTSVSALDEDVSIFPPEERFNAGLISEDLELLTAVDKLRIKMGTVQSPSLLNQVVNILQNAVGVWYSGDERIPEDFVHASNDALLGLLSDMQEVVHEAVSICSHLRHDTNYMDVFSRIHVNYSQVVLNAMAELIEQDLKVLVSAVAGRFEKATKRSGNDGKTTSSGIMSSAGGQDSNKDAKIIDSLAMESFRLFTVVDHFCKKSSYVLHKSGITQVVMANHHNLFSNCVSAWIAAVDRQVESQINTIVKIEVDRVRTGLLKDTVVDGISQSAREAVDVIEEVVNTYWKPLQIWPSATVAFSASVGLSDQVIAAISQRYSSELLRSLKEITFFKQDAAGSIDLTLQACTFLSNIQYVQEKGVEKHLLGGTMMLAHRPSIGSAVTSSSLKRSGSFDKTLAPLDEQLRGVLDKLVMSLREDLVVGLKMVLASVLKMIRPLFVKDVLELVKVSHKYTVDLPAQVVQLLLLHASQLISQLICNNVPQNAFDCFLECLWSLCIDCVHAGIKDRLAKGMSREHCQLVYDAVKLFHGFFEECNERISLNTPQFKGLLRGLELARLTSEQLIIHYFYLDVETQEQVISSSGSHGVVQLRPILKYHKLKFALAVNVLNFKGVDMLDKIASSGDVCFRLELCPRHLFPTSISIFTARIASKSSQTLDMKITFPVPEGSSVAMQNGVLLVTLIHREWWGIYETTIAQAVMPLHSVARPILGGPDVIQPSDKLVELHFVKPTAHPGVVQVLQSRAKSDKFAGEFVTWHSKKLARKDDKEKIQSPDVSDQFDLFQ